jgi:hypothetical protein
MCATVAFGLGINKPGKRAFKFNFTFDGNPFFFRCPICFPLFNAEIDGILLSGMRKRWPGWTIG